ncbi:desulfoferrodoxin family protein [Methanosphaera sp.]|uniref:desulfoferrodoxin family protein n=1 Tax=Methanosphaera sp. TaxID=2666342 RepID=UPI002E762061|nr:desulfoferrodoxin family protein [Methanosphaera sp.]MEE1117715.1 desulfoferrodoxin family protein [Methanosphaera sp.]
MADFDKTSIVLCKNSGNVIEIIKPGNDVDVAELNVIEAKTEGEGSPKHVPIVTRLECGYHVKVGEVEHPMDEDHYIAMIELIADGQIHKQYLNPGDKPEAYFQIPEAECVEAREFCTLHGLWKA